MLNKMVYLDYWQGYAQIIFFSFSLLVYGFQSLPFRIVIDGQNFFPINISNIIKVEQSIFLVLRRYSFEGFNTFYNYQGPLNFMLVNQF